MSAELRAPQTRRDFRPGRRFVVLALAVASSTARAAEPIRWEAPPECPDRSRLLAVVAELTGRDAAMAPSDLRMRGVVQRRAQGWQVSLTLMDGPRERSRVITAPSCEELVRATGVAVALALTTETALTTDAALDPATRNDRTAEPAAQPANASPSAPPEAREAPARGVSDAEPRSDLPEAPRSMTLAWLIEAGGLLDDAALGGPAPGFALRRASVEDGGSVTSPSTSTWSGAVCAISASRRSSWTTPCKTCGWWCTASCPRSMRAPR